MEAGSVEAAEMESAPVADSIIAAVNTLPANAEMAVVENA
jgi:hypothetical protein